MPYKTKNQIAWEKLNEELAFIDKIEEKGYYKITTEQIKNIGKREPRLMAKFDHSVNRPPFFRENRVSLLPISRSAYKLMKFDSFQPVEYKEDSQLVDLYQLRRYQTIKLEDITSEDNALVINEIAEILHSFTGEDELKMTVRGKFGTDSLSFNVDTAAGIQQLDVEGAGAELDAGYEGNKIYLVEAKLGKVDDFNIRQLYFPYKYWREKVTKEIVSVFFTYSDGIFSLWSYTFEDPNNFNSIRLINHQNYKLEEDEIEITEEAILGEIEEFKPSDVSDIPFPQADDFEKVINIVELVNAGVDTKEDLADYFSFRGRQADYYYNAAKYLGLVKLEEGIIYLTNFGHEVNQAPRTARHYKLAKEILSHKVFYDAYIEYRANTKITNEQVVEIMKRNNVLSGKTESMFKRRAQTIIAWCRWILTLSTN